MRNPTCGQCERVGLTCGYDERRWTFVGQEDTANVVLTKSLTRTAFELRIDEDFWTQYLPQEDPATVPGFGAGAKASSWVPTLRHLATQDSTTRLALSATAFVTLGRLNNDEIVRQGTRLYAQALRETNRVLQHPTLYQRDSVLASSRFLALFEVFRGDICG